MLHYKTGLPSSVLAEHVPVLRLLKSFPGLHTLDEEAQAEIICTDFGLKADAAQKDLI